MKAWLLGFASIPLLVACGGTDSALGGGGGNTTTIGDGGTITDNGGTVSFSAAQAFLTRGGSWCGSPPPFSPKDPFDLVLYGEPESQPMPWPTIQIVVYANAPVGSPESLTLVPWKPGAAVTQGENDVNVEDGYLNDASGNPLLAFDLARGMTASKPDANAFDQATMTVLAIPKKEGDSLEVRVQLHFTDGATLDQTFVSPLLDEQETPCAGAANQ
ncbi:MAG: hypothetical protein ACRELY_11100 [Polyangiaceae bacterium]